ncbi:MAG TPA: hypothetical protein VJ647_06740 [Chitinophagaceae bacterium]|nr:hypothetical protein [Chitinophagaceae bacterium]
MKSTRKIASLKITGRYLSVLLMLFLLNFLTVGNWFVYGEPFSIAGVVIIGNDNSDACDSDKRPITSEEEKSSSKSISNNLTEEYLHDQDLFLHLYTLLASRHNGHVHSHGFGDDHSRLHCPPPDVLA